MWGRQARAAKENRHDGQERALLENALKRVLQEEEESVRGKVKRRALYAEETVCKRPCR